MKSKVYYICVSNSDSQSSIKDKLSQLFTKSKLLDFLHKGERVAIKMHFGEEGNTGFVRPEFVRIACDRIIENGAHPFISDTNTLYRGRRTNTSGHLKLAYEHGFTLEICGAEVIIPDDTKKENIAEVVVNHAYIKIAKVAKLFLEADVLIGIAHFKGHIMTGFGGALKNIGMGCATREGKLSQHSDISPIVYASNCTGCGACVEACPVDAIAITDNKAKIDNAKCIGCATCIAVCNFSAVDVNWGAGGGTMQEKMIEYASAVLKSKKKAAFINFATKITKECDCLAKDDPRIVPDVGILASFDPVALDKASFDLVNKAAGRDIFKEAHPERDGLKQLKHAVALGLGSLEYELVAIS